MTPCDIAAPDAAFLPPDFSGEIQHQADGFGGLLFESLESAVCDGFERVLVELGSYRGEDPGQPGLWAEWVDQVTLDSGEIVPIEGSQILVLSIIGATWQPDTGGTHGVSGPTGDPIAEAQYQEQSGGSAGLFVGLIERSEFRAFTLADPYRVVVDVRSPS
ncbi:hypothetical protein EXU48_21030 [Occultella glacieicola]|uniref:AMIN-like domain-containing protein n=1 Tax=Occultella glacieicola TaxID=2518684 RepID=A0ABY2E0B0_9MICO|nr:hypothetical protein [Occultella glacieicola]TDE89213.1 hypothetical protein EXU48_21030 [Occultella glacieicola]